MRILLFDIDGTLLHAGRGPEQAFERAFEQLFGIADCWGKTAPHGRTDLDIMQEVCLRVLGRRAETDEMKRLWELYTKFLAETLGTKNGFRLLSGVEALCRKLSQMRSVYLGIETGNIEGAGRLKLRHGGIESYFTFGGWGSDSAERSEIITAALERAARLHNLPDFRPERHVTVIGDAPQDVRAGKVVGARTIAVATGKYTAEGLAEERPDVLLENLASIDEFLAAAEIDWD